MIKKCIHDDKEFEAQRATARFCSDRCRKAYVRKEELLGTSREHAITKPTMMEEVEVKAQAGLMSKEERLRLMNERLRARGLPLLTDQPESISFIETGIPAIDALTGEADDKKVGGFPRKHITELFGPKGSGKTSLMKLIAQNTKGLTVLYIDAENGMIKPPDWIDVNKSTSIETVEGLVFEGVRSGYYDLIIIDSVAVLTSQKEMEAEKDGMMAKPKAMAQFIRRVNAALRPIGADGYPDPSPGTAVVFINQLRDTGNTFGTREYTPGGRSVEYQASLRLELRTAKADLILKDGGAIGQHVRVRVEKSRFGPRDQTTKFKIMYGDIA